MKQLNHCTLHFVVVLAFLLRQPRIRTRRKQAGEEGVNQMRRAIVALSMLLLCGNGCAKVVPSEQGSVKSAAEQEIRAALCDMDKRDYASAQKKLERVLQSDPKNLYARKVLLGSLAQQIKPGDKSAENIALIRKAIEAYQQAMNNPQFTSEEKSRMDHYAVLLYGMISEEELKNELQKRALDSNRTAKDRAEAYAVLAGKYWDCAYRITSAKSALATSEIENVEKCVAFGMEYTDAAIRLDAENESAWNFKALLLSESAKLYGLKNDRALKAEAQRQANEAQKRGTELANARRDAQEKEWAKQNEERKKNDSFTSADAEKAAKELTEYRAETSLDEAVKDVFFPQDLELTSLVAPVPIPEEKTAPTSTTGSAPKQKESQDKETQSVPSSDKNAKAGCFREIDPPALVQEKRNWKSFSPDGDLVVDLPDNVCASGGGHVAASEGVMYTISSMDRPQFSLSPTVIERVLNILARTFVGLRSGNWVGSPGRSFELKLLRKEDVNGQPRKVYSYLLISCSERKENVL